MCGGGAFYEARASRTPFQKCLAAWTAASLLPDPWASQTAGANRGCQGVPLLE